MIHKHASFIVTGAILVTTVATMTFYNANIVNAQLGHVPSVPSMTKTITPGLGNMSKTISKTLNDWFEHG
jgi:hypothetical protein